MEKWTKDTHLCTICDALVEVTRKGEFGNIWHCGAECNLLSVEDATINTNNEQKEETPMNATTEFLERQVAALQDLLEKKEEYIIRLQDDNSQKSQAIYTVRAEQENFRNTVKEYVLESLQDSSITHEVAEALANICDFELSKKITITSTVDFEIEVEVPFDVDADDVIASLEYSVDAFDYSIDDFGVNVESVNWEDNIS